MSDRILVVEDEQFGNTKVVPRKAQPHGLSWTAREAADPAVTLWSGRGGGGRRLHGDWTLP